MTCGPKAQQQMTLEDCDAGMPGDARSLLWPSQRQEGISATIDVK